MEDGDTWRAVSWRIDFPPGRANGGRYGAAPCGGRGAGAWRGRDRRALDDGVRHDSSARATFSTLTRCPRLWPFLPAGTSNIFLVCSRISVRGNNGIVHRASLTSHGAQTQAQAAGGAEEGRRRQRR